MNSGFGWSLLSSYTFFPFLPTLTTLYLINNPVTIPWYYLVAIGLINLLGYVIYRYTNFNLIKEKGEEKIETKPYLDARMSYSVNMQVPDNWL